MILNSIMKLLIKNDDTIDWQTFNNRNEENKFNKKLKHNDELIKNGINRFKK